MANYTLEEETNMAAFRRTHSEVINTGDTNSVAELIAPEVIMKRYGFAAIGQALRPANAPMQPNHGEFDALEQFSDGLRRLRAAFPDYHHSIDHIFARDDWVAARWTLTCTHLGPFMGLPPTGNAIRIEETGLMRFSKGRMVEGWFMADELNMIKELGVTLVIPTATRTE